MQKRLKVNCHDLVEFYPNLKIT